ncbi:MAG: ABC transporter permease [Planctomycetota bacterium]
MSTALRQSPIPLRLLAAVATLVASWLPLLPVLAPLLDLERLLGVLDGRTALLLWRSLWMSAASAAGAILLGGGFAMLVTPYRFPGVGILRTCLPLPLFLPPLLTAQAWFGLVEMSGPWAAVFTFAVCYAPIPGLLVARALSLRAASADAAALALGPTFHRGELLRLAKLPALTGGALVFLLAAADFAVPDYFAVVGELFHVYAAEIFGHSRSDDAFAGATASLPLVLLGLIVLLIAVRLREGQRVQEVAEADAAPPRELRGVSGTLALLGGIALVGLLILAPLGRILYETGLQGPASDRAWSEVSSQAFTDALTRGRGDILRTLSYSSLAGLLCLAIAPIWAHALLHGSRRRRMLLTVALGLPLLVPSVAMGFGAIVVFNQPWLDDLYQSIFMPAILVAGRFLPLAVVLLAERMARVPASGEEAAALSGMGYARRLFGIRLAPQRGAWILAAALVVVFAMRELDFAILLPAANRSAAVRYYNALHFSRDNFVAAYGLVLAMILFLPWMLAATWQNLRRPVR